MKVRFREEIYDVKLNKTTGEVSYNGQVIGGVRKVGRSKWEITKLDKSYSTYCFKRSEALFWLLSEHIDPEWLTL